MQVVHVIEGVNPEVHWPHGRQHCGKYSQETHASLYCANCYCLVCDEPAPCCPEWTEHCKATDTDPTWRAIISEVKKYKGRKVLREFQGGMYAGEVKDCWYCEADNKLYYRVLYDDNDKDDLEETELLRGMETRKQAIWDKIRELTKYFGGRRVAKMFEAKPYLGIVQHCWYDEKDETYRFQIYYELDKDREDVDEDDVFEMLKCYDALLLHKN